MWIHTAVAPPGACIAPQAHPQAQHSRKDLSVAPWKEAVLPVDMWEGRSRVTSHKQVDGCNALVTAVDITTTVGACIPVSGLGNTESADGVVTEGILFAIPCNFRLS